MADIEKKLERIVKLAFPSARSVELNGGKGVKGNPYHITVYAYMISEDYLHVTDGHLGTCDYDLTKAIAQKLIAFGYKNFNISLEACI